MKQKSNKKPKTQKSFFRFEKQLPKAQMNRVQGGVMPRLIIPPPGG